MSGTWRIAPAFLSAALLSTPLVLAADPPKRPWTDTAELGLVLTGGNTEIVSFAASNKFIYTWSNADLTVDAAAIRTDATTVTPENVGGTLVVTESKDTTAAAYLLTSKYRRTIREGFIWYVHLGGNRNRFTGIAARYFVGGGLGYRAIATPKHTLVVEAGLNYNDESYVETSDPLQKSFMDLRAFLGYAYQISESAKFTNDFEVLENTNETRDLRLRNIASVVASLTKKVALKVGLTAVWDREPVVKVLSDPNAPAAPTVRYEYESLDTVLAASLVINF